jgi:methyltransferase (TIGR00027 family)
MRAADDNAPAKPSLTALRVAALRRSFTRLPHASGDPAAEDRLVAEILGDAAPPAPSRTTEYRARFRRYLEGRTRFFDAFTIDAIESGIDQVVIVAAGYDGRAMRYATPGVTFFEIDHPDTQQHKRQLMTALGLPSAGIEFVAVDLVSGSAAAALGSISHSRSRSSAFLVEGLAVYIPREDLGRLLVDLRGAAAAGSRLAVSFLGRADADVGRAALAMHVASLGEPMRAQIDGSEFRAMLTESGWRIDDAGSGSPNLIAAVAA